LNTTGVPGSGGSSGLAGALDALLTEGMPVSAAQQGQLEAYAGLVREWNAFASLVSAGDLAEFENRHVVDALSLAPVVRGVHPEAGTLVDIGTGSGIPGIPLAAVLADWQVTLVERSSKKVAFLRKVVGAVGLENVAVVHGRFPEAAGAGSVYTARAVERPEEIGRALAARMPVGSVYLCQSEATGAFGAGMFHVEHYRDGWTETGLRRGALYVVRRVR